MVFNVPVEQVILIPVSATGGIPMAEYEPLRQPEALHAA
jgi:hypothetical protein